MVGKNRGKWNTVAPVFLIQWSELYATEFPQTAVLMYSTSNNRTRSEGELAGVGRIGVAGKTVCQDCSMHSQCSIPPRLLELMTEYQKPFEQRDYEKIRESAMEGEAEVHLYTTP